MTSPITDEFTRADSTTNLGSCDQAIPWIQSGGPWGISSDMAYTSVADSSSNGGIGACAYIDHGWADGTITVDVSALDTSINDWAGLVLRYTDASNNWNLNIIWDNNTSGDQYAVYLQSSIGGFAFYTLLPVGTGPWTLEVAMSGSSYTVKVDGTIQGTATDSFNDTETNHGLNIGSITGITARLDNYDAVISGGGSTTLAVPAQALAAAGEDPPRPTIQAVTAGALAAAPTPGVVTPAVYTIGTAT